jgi:4-amino-4-deoxy-L-arabinose transferase-like glycosyltransferase
MLKNYSPLTIFGWTLLIIYLSFHLVTLTKIQDVYGDEPADMQTAWTLLKTGQVGSYSGRDVLSPSFRFLTNAFPYHLRPFVSHYYGLFIRLFGLSLTTARFTSWCSIALGMVILYALSLRLFGPLGGLASLTLLLADPILGTCIHICREEAPLFAATVLVLSLWHWAFTRESFWLGFLAGCGASLSSGIHPNGILLIPALGAMALVAHRSSAGWNRTAGGGGPWCGLRAYPLGDRLPLG